MNFLVEWISWNGKQGLEEVRKVEVGLGGDVLCSLYWETPKLREKMDGYEILYNDG